MNKLLLKLAMMVCDRYPTFLNPIGRAGESHY